MPRSRKRFLVQNGGNADIEVARARGNYVYDTRGRKYIDFIMGWCVGNFGWARPALRRRVHAFRGPDYIYPEYAYKSWRELAQLLVGLAPKGLTRCCRATGGSEAVELALQAAMLHTGRRKFVAIEDAYHGNTLGALSVGDGDDAVRVLSVARLKPPLDGHALDRLETRLKRRDVAAAKKCRARGLLLDPQESVLLMLPALNASARRHGVRAALLQHVAVRGPRRTNAAVVHRAVDGHPRHRARPNGTDAVHRGAGRRSASCAPEGDIARRVVEISGAGVRRRCPCNAACVDNTTRRAAPCVHVDVRAGDRRARSGVTLPGWPGRWVRGESGANQ